MGLYLIDSIVKWCQICDFGMCLGMGLEVSDGMFSQMADGTFLYIQRYSGTAIGNKEQVSRVVGMSINMMAWLEE